MQNDKLLFPSGLFFINRLAQFELDLVKFAHLSAMQRRKTLLPPCRFNGLKAP